MYYLHAFAVHLQISSCILHIGKKICREHYTGVFFSFGDAFLIIALLLIKALQQRKYVRQGLNLALKSPLAAKISLLPTT